MSSSLHKWIAAIAFSLVVHVGIAAQFQQPVEDVLISGGASVQVASLGNAFADAIASGDPEELLEPEESSQTELEPVETLVTEAQVPETQAAETPVPETQAPTQAVITPVEPELKKVETSQPVEVAALIPDTAVAPQVQPKLAPETPLLETVPIPEKRETIEPVAKPKPAKNKSTKKKPVEKNKKAAGRKEGKSKRDAKAGTNTGSVKSTAKNEGRKKRKASQSGNASASNYPGKIVRKLRRALRYPKAARKKRIRGEVMVSFVISRSGKVSGVRILRGSGSKILDDAALKTVYRAAPFPKIPDGAAKSRWPFEVPLAFN